jgi:hypothetical protein
MAKKTTKDKMPAETKAAIVKGIRRLPNFIEDAYLKSEQDKYHILLSDANLFIQQLKGCYAHWFPKSKPIKVVDIINNVHRHDVKDWKVWMKYSLACLINTSERIFENVKEAKKLNREDLFLKEIELLKEISFEAAVFLEDAFAILDEEKVDFGHWKRFNLWYREVFDASEQLLRKYVHPNAKGSFVVGPTSIFLLRQGIELWVKSLFGINYVSDLSGKPIKLQPERLFEFLDTKNCSLPIERSVITRIHKWTQPYVHGGWMGHIWEAEIAQHYLRPIFYPQNVKVKKSFYDDMQKQMEKLLGKKDIIVHRMKTPAGEVVEKL